MLYRDENKKLLVLHSYIKRSIEKVPQFLEIVYFREEIDHGIFIHEGIIIDCDYDIIIVRDSLSVEHIVHLRDLYYK